MVERNDKIVIMGKIAIIILNYNSSADCRKCVGFLLRQQGVDLEIIIVDNRSRPDDRQAVEELCKEHGFTFIPAKENRGYNAGNNIGLRYAAKKGYKYALIANPDMEFPQADYVRCLAAVMEECPEVVVCGSDIISPEGRHQNPQREATYWEELFWFVTILRNHKNKRWFLGDYTQNDYCEKVSGCCLMTRLSFIKDIGFFDENVFLYCEESILSKQVRRTNAKMYYLSSACAVHCHIEKSKGNPSKRLQQGFRSRCYYLQQYSGYRNMQLWMLLRSKWIQRMLYKYSLCSNS